MATITAPQRHQGKLLLGLTVLVALVTVNSPAVDVFRCVDGDGTVIFSEAECGPDAEQRSYQGAEPLSGSKAPPDSPKLQLQRYRKEVKAVEKLIGKDAPKPAAVSKKTSGPNCNGVTRLQLRNARVSKELLKCHSKQDVKSILGDPDRVETFSDRSYDTRWSYYYDSGSKRIFFTADRVSRINTREDKDN